MNYVELRLHFVAIVPSVNYEGILGSKDLQKSPNVLAHVTAKTFPTRFTVSS